MSSELRFDLVSKNWIVIATGRAKRPGAFAELKRKPLEQSEKDCPFCNVTGLAEGDKPTLIYRPGSNEKLDVNKFDRKSWGLMAIPNKYPAFFRGDSLNERAEGPYSLMDGIGFHEVIITRDHHRSFAQLSAEEIKQVIDAYQERYLELMNEKFINYVSVFHNHGLEAGASIAHNHSQIIAIPVIDSDIRDSLDGSRRFMEVHGRCVHCAMAEWDMEDGRRIIYENDKFLVEVPFAPKISFEMRIYPKEHHAYFERIKEEDKTALADALKISLSKLHKGLNDPPFNFFLHTAPCDGKDYNHYHWHFEIMPKTAIWAGFELGAGMEISVITPEEAAKYLRETNV